MDSVKIQIQRMAQNVAVEAVSVFIAWLIFF